VIKKVGNLRAKVSGTLFFGIKIGVISRADIENNHVDKPVMCSK